MILAINCGSSSLRYGLFKSGRLPALARGMVDHIGMPTSTMHQRSSDRLLRVERPIASYSAAIDLVLQQLCDARWDIINDLSDLSAIGHRVVHGGSRFFDPTLVDASVLSRLDACSDLAPLHNPINVDGIRHTMTRVPGAAQIAVFDTAFHHNMPAAAQHYGLPYHLNETLGIRRYGFHGLSCRYASCRAAALLGRPASDLKMIICHLGSGVTINAIDGGQSVDTSTGFGTFSGVMMGTRAGDFDPEIAFYLSKSMGMSFEQIRDMCLHQSGLLGLSGISGDMCDVLDKAERGDMRAGLAIDVFVQMVKRCIGASVAILGGLDCLVFTAGIGENSPTIRARICAGLEYLGISIDKAANTRNRPDSRINDGRVVLLVIATDEESVIATDTERVLARHAHNGDRRLA